MFQIMRKLCGLFLLLVAVSCGIFFYALHNAPAFENGECYTFYSQKNSSAKAYVTKTPALDKFFLGNVAGESVRYDGNRLPELWEKYEAKLLFVEEACGVENYYFSSPKFSKSVRLGGYDVNLQISVSKDKTSVGTPLIFGGF